RRSNSTTRRQKIRKDLQAKNLNAKEAWALQQELLHPGASEALMLAAGKFLQSKHYEDVVGERVVEGICGYPPCGKAAEVVPESKRWSVSYSECKVFDTGEISRFCSSECRRASGSFALSLHPEPAYIRPDSAVAQSRSAVAQAPHDRAKAEIARTPEEPTSQSVHAKDCTAALEASAAGPASVKPLPKVRPKAVVKFSRQSHTYSVNYTDYDGGGELPDVRPAADFEPVAPILSSKASVSQILKAPVIERETFGHGSSYLQVQGEASEQGEALPERKATAKNRPSVRFAEKSEATEKEEEDVEEDEEQQELQELGAVADDGDSDLDDNGLFEPDSVIPNGQSDVVSFVRAWAVLSCWLIDPALQVLRGAAPVRFNDDKRPGHKGRRDLLCELLSSRMPGELAFLSTRFHDLASSLGVHQTLPSVTEHSLYDLLAALLLQGLLHVEVQKGVLEQDSFQAGVMKKRTKDAAKKLGISDSELHTLATMVT
ncbi:unnamed protein product, partial [Polarella glacialis]